MKMETWYDVPSRQEMARTRLNSEVGCVLARTKHSGRAATMDKPLYWCMTKATTAEGEELRRSLNWVISRRGILKVMPDALVCGNWRIPYSQIDEAVLFSIWSLLPGFLLRVKSKGKTYQFGLNWNPFWKRELPFPVAREKGKLKHSAFSIVIRLILVGYIVYWIWKHYGG